MRRRISATLAILSALAGVAAIATTSGCASAKPPSKGMEVRVFRCDDEVGFVASLGRERATISTRSHHYELQVRPSSLGVRYGSDDVAFAQDEERAVLIGAADGPYRNCTLEERTADA